MSTTFCLSVRTECASDDNTTRTDFSHYFRSLAEVVLNTLHLTYKQASKSITTHGWWAEVGLSRSEYRSAPGKVTRRNRAFHPPRIQWLDAVRRRSQNGTSSSVIPWLNSSAGGEAAAGCG